MGGVASVQARISAIETQFGNLPASGRLGGQLAADFEASLNRAETAAAKQSPPVQEATAHADVAQPRAGRTPYLNGNIPRSSLIPIDPTGHLLSPPAAQAFRQMTAAAALDNVTIGINDAYRSIEDQRTIAKLKGLYSKGGLAASPGTSAHGWGLAVDLDLDAAALDWMRRNAPQYGFAGNVSREDWHWTYQPESATSGTMSA